MVEARSFRGIPYFRLFAADVVASDQAKSERVFCINSYIIAIIQGFDRAGHDRARCP